MELQISNVCKSFGEKEVLRDVSLTAQGGAAHGLLGRNGAGKTTTIRIIMGVFYPDSGKILADGKPLDRQKVQLGYMPEERGMYPKKLICDQLVYLGVLRGMSRSDAKKACEKWLERLGMSEYSRKKLETLSKGNQQKIQLAATLMCHPQLVILDEPFSGLDPVNAMLLKDVINEMIHSGTTVLFSSHQMNYIEEFCETISILNAGKIVLDGKITDIKRSYPRDRIAVTSPQFEKVTSFVLEKMSDQIITADADETREKTAVFRMKEPGFKSRLLSEIARGGFDIDSFQVCEPSLNDIFVEYTEAGI